MEAVSSQRSVYSRRFLKKDLADGWNVEMQLKVVKQGLRIREAPPRLITEIEQDSLK